MYEQFDDDEFDDTCPQCVVGRITSVIKPYLKLFRGQLFTVPDALYYCCDLCDYQDVDDSTFNIISHMMFSAGVRESTDDKSSPLPSPYEEETPHKSDPSRL